MEPKGDVVGGTLGINQKFKLRLLEISIERAKVSGSRGGGRNGELLEKKIRKRRSLQAPQAAYQLFMRGLGTGIR